MAKKKSAAPKRASKTASNKASVAKKKSRRVEKEGYFEGMEPLTIAAIESAAEEYEIAKEARMEASEIEVAAKKKLKAAMEQHEDELAKNADGWPTYHARNIGRVVTLEAVEMTVKVKKEAVKKAAETDE